MAEPVGSGGEGVAVAGARTVASTGHASRNGPHGENRAEITRTPPSRGGRGGRADGSSWRSPAAWRSVLGAWKGGPWVRDYFSHVATDDAFVAGDATTVASRLADVVEQVLVHNDDYVERGTILVRLDRQPFELAVDQMRSDLQQAKLNVDRMVKSLETARAGLDQARDQVRSSVAALEEAWRAVEGQQEQVRSRIAGLRSQAASLRAVVRRARARAEGPRARQEPGQLSDGDPRGARPEAGGVRERTREIQGGRAVGPAGPRPARPGSGLSTSRADPRGPRSHRHARSAAPWPPGSRSWRTWASPPACSPWSRKPCTRP